MTLYKPDEIREWTPAERQKRLEELRAELSRLRASSFLGGATENPSRIRVIKKNIARILTIMREEELKGSKGV
ncbi:MAG: 50S ribosomal protein L29 [Candidatus Asgardarchaeia archaeon]